MPSSVTDPIHEGRPTTMRALLLDAIRITVIGHVLDGRALPERFYPDPHHRVEADKARARLAAVEAWTAEQADDLAETDHQAQKSAHDGYIASRKASAERYDEMSRRVEAWKVPANVADFKGLALRHLAEMKGFDCPEPSSNDPVPYRMPGSMFRDEARERVKRSIEYHEREWAKEVSRCEERTAWLTAFLAALPPEGDPSDTPIGGAP
jgi:hypothetical protein